MNTLLTKQLPEAPGKEIEVITVNYPPGAVDTIHLGNYRRGDTLWDIAYRRLQNTNDLRPLRSSAFVICYRHGHRSWHQDAIRLFDLLGSRCSILTVVLGA